MIAYIYIKESKYIICKIDNVKDISDINKEINGEYNSIKYGDSQDYIILENDKINKNIGDMIDVDNLVDYRKYFIDKDNWYQEQINNQINTISNLDSLLKTTNETIEGFMNFYFEQNPDQV